jgi:hypothetical protein
MSEAQRDQNHVTSALGVSSSDATLTLPLKVDPVTGRLLTNTASGDGDVVGPASSTDNAVVRFDGTTGKLIQNSTAILTDAGALSGLTDVSASGTISAATAITVEETGVGTDRITIQAPASIVAGYTLTLPVDDGNNLQVLQTDGSGVLAWATLPSGTVTAVSVVSANGFAGSSGGGATPALTLSTTINAAVLKGNGTAISAATTTGSGSTVVLNDTPTLIAPILGTPTSGNLANTTGYPVSVLAGLGTGVATALAVNVGTDGAFVVKAGALGTPSSGVGTNITGIPAANVLAGSFGAGAFVMSSSLQVVTIELGNATDTTISRVSGGVIAVEGVTVPTISSTSTFTNKRITRRLVTASAPGATPTTNSDNCDIAEFTSLGTAITSMTTNLSGTPVNGDFLEFRFLDDGTARAITWGTSFAASTIALPTTTVISTMLRVLFEYQTTASLNKWVCVASA